MGTASRRLSPLATSDAEPAVVSVSNQQLAATIERVILDRTGGKIQRLKVEIRRETIVLHGVCPTFYAKQLAQHAAMRLAGNLTVANDLKVI